MYFDSHVHFNGSHDATGIDALVERALAARVTRMMAVGGSCELNKWAIEAADRHPGHVMAAVGYDRDQAEEQVAAPLGVEDGIDRLRFSIGHFQERGTRVGALGEMGLDYHYKRETAADQRRLFDAQLALARELALPVIVHSREAEADTLDALARYRDGAEHHERLGVLHCFTGDAPFARALLELGMCISFSGIVTFKTAESLRLAVCEVPDERLLVETDTPFLAPVPHRGKRNEPAYVPRVVEVLAAVRGSTPEAVARLSFENATRLFGWD